jgi:tRNA (guanine-N7-)-methyltransferase
MEGHEVLYANHNVYVNEEVQRKWHFSNILWKQYLEINKAVY